MDVEFKVGESFRIVWPNGAGYDVWQVASTGRPVMVASYEINSGGGYMQVQVPHA